MKVRTFPYPKSGLIRFIPRISRRKRSSVELIILQLLFTFQMNLSNMRELDWSTIILKSVVAALALLVISRFFPPLRFLLLGGLLLASFACTVYVVYYYFQERKEQRQRAESTQGQIEKWMARCEEQLERFNREVAGIEQSIDQLQEQLRITSNPDESTRLETNRVLEGLRREIELRHAKQHFFKECQERLDALLQNIRLQEELNQKKQQLRDLQDQQYDDLAEMEEIRWNLDQQSTYLQTIAELSQRAADTESIDHTEHLVKELERMRPAS